MGRHWDHGGADRHSRVPAGPPVTPPERRPCMQQHEEHERLSGLPPPAAPRTRSLTIAPEVHLKQAVSLPMLHKPVNLSRPGATRSRVELLQRQFEHAGISEPLALRDRAAPFRNAAVADERGRERERGARRSKQAHERQVRLASLPLDESVVPARTRPGQPMADASSSSAPIDPPIKQQHYGSVANMLELGLAEAFTARKLLANSATPLAESLEIASRDAAEACLVSLRQLAAVTPPAFGPFLQRIADALEPCLLSATHTDDDGRRLTHEQVAEVLLMPQLEGERERADESSRQLESMVSMLKSEMGRSTSLQKTVDEQAPQARHCHRERARSPSARAWPARGGRLDLT